MENTLQQVAPGRTRVSFVDNLKVLLTVLVIVHHVAVMYSGLGSWYYNESGSIGLTVFAIVNQSWFMGAFFLLSGYFTPASYDRKGPRALLRDRLFRLGIPLVVFYFVLNPILYVGSHQHYWHTVGAGPLWFVLALLVFDLCYAAVRRLTSRTIGERTLTYPMVLGFVGVLAVVTYLFRIVVPIGFWMPVVDFPTGAYLPQYVSFFALGVVAYRRGWLSTVPARLGWIAAGGTLVFLPLALTGDFTGHGSLASLSYAFWDSSFAVGVVAALLALFRRRFNSPRSQSTKTFTVYVIHAFLVTAAGYALSPVALPAPAKFAIVALIVVPACFLLAGPVRRLPGVRRVL